MAQEQQAFYEMFVNLLRTLFDAENQIVQNLPLVIKAVSHPELREALSQHLEETKGQQQRLKKIFKLLNENPTGITCKAMQGLFADGEEILKKDFPPNVKDACLIVNCQMIEHFEIAGYGSARAIAHQLNDTSLNERIDFDEIADMLQQTLDEESAADEKLTDLAEGGFFTQGINEEAKTTEEPKTTKRRTTER